MIKMLDLINDLYLNNIIQENTLVINKDYIELDKIKYVVLIHDDITEFYDNKVKHVVIKRDDGKNIDENWWQILMKIKNKVIGNKFVAYQVFPAKNKNIDTKNQYHLFVIDNENYKDPLDISKNIPKNKK